VTGPLSSTTTDVPSGGETRLPTTKPNDEVRRRRAASAAGPGREYLRGVSAGGLVVLDGAVLLRDSRLFIDQAEEAP